MPRITDIKRQKRNRERVSVFLDGDFWTGMSEALYLELGLSPGADISAQRKREIEALVVEDKALGWAIERLTSRPLSESQLRSKLREREYGPAVIELIVERCRGYGLLDDRALAEMLIHNRREAGHGRRRIAQHLREIGIARELAEELLEEAFDPERETEEAAKVLERRYGDKRLDPREADRATQFLLRRGFSFTAAKDAVAGYRMSDAEQEIHYGVERALDDLRRRYRRRAAERNKAFAFLARRGFSPEAIQAAIAAYETETSTSSSSSSR